MIARKVKVVLGVIGADCHAVGNKIIMSVLEPLGIDVVNLGVMVSQEEFVDAAIETGAEAILVSSIYGHGEIDCMGFRDHCVERGLSDILLYVGGNLVIGKREFSKIESHFKGMGFDRVFRPSVDLAEVANLLKADLSQKRSIQKPDVEPSEFRKAG
ncbi:MAG: methylaspartate mutase subunit S [Mesorhizobium sp.]|uniref:methylaspartate mutase subunit S n=1 Tax=Mesorhizobium sp. TaxID=1871066 RepID=UPI000FE4A247|nr:methylaspartate mutase subunit S [Mesorhizobium sp.]RWA98692.1 MAG: methylaspartate mutase subunit S [Mesorhizobium sp.]RWB10994.1 MAG: methylaspartate mutase subunit S [Mesorhizobium sp.]